MPLPAGAERPGSPRNWQRVVDGFLQLAPRLMSQETMNREAARLARDMVECGIADLAVVERHLETTSANMRFLALPVSQIDMRGSICVDPRDRSPKPYALAILLAVNAEHAEVHFAERIPDPELNLGLLATQTGFLEPARM